MLPINESLDLLTFTPSTNVSFLCLHHDNGLNGVLDELIPGPL